MSSRSSTSSSRRSLALGAPLVALVYGALELGAVPRTAYFGGRKLAAKFERLAALERDEEVRVFVVGPSFVDQGFDAQLFGERTGRTTFDLGVSGTDMYFQSLLLRDVVLAGRTPEAVLWSLRDETLSRSNINRQYLAAPALAYARGPLGARGFELGRHLPQFHRRRLFDWLRELFDLPFGPVDEPLDRHGQTELATLTREERQAARGRDDAAEEAGASGFLAEDYAVDLAQAEEHVAETLRILRERGVSVWFVLTPYHESVFARRSGYAELVLTDANAAYSQWIAGLGVPVLDLRYCEELSTRPEYFFDSRHLNGPGASAFSELMARLYLGERPVPDAWKGMPSRAQREALLGRIERERIPRIELGVRVPREELACVRQEGRVVSCYGSFVAEEEGEYELVLADREPRVRVGSFFARVGGGWYAAWSPGPEATEASVAASARVEPGEHVFELHARVGEQAIEWGEVMVVRR